MISPKKHSPDCSCTFGHVVHIIVLKCSSRVFAPHLAQARLRSIFIEIVDLLSLTVFSHVRHVSHASTYRILVVTQAEVTVPTVRSALFAILIKIEPDVMEVMAAVVPEKIVSKSHFTCL